MGSRREEERNERIIRGLMKLPPNRRCINCNSLGPQYVCTNFWTFVCMTCSGIHREFTHRVKSVSMSKFTSQEVEALQNGGNQRAREIYLKDWDLQRQRLPDNSNVDKVRDFIKTVYVNKRYAGGKSADKPPRDLQRLGSHEDDTRRASSYHSYSQSPPYDFQYEDRRYGKQAAVLTRKPGSDRGLYAGKMSSFISSPTRLSDRSLEDRFANEGSVSRFSDYSVSSGGDPVRSGVESPNFQKNGGFSSPPVQSSRNIVGEDLFSEAHFRRDANGIPHRQRTASLGSVGSFDSNSMSHKSYNSGNFADSISEPEQTAQAHQDNMSTFPQAATSVSHCSLNLFEAPIFPESGTSPAPPLDLFQLPAASQSTSVDLFQTSSNSASAVNLNNFSQTSVQSSVDLFADTSQQQPAAKKDEKSVESHPKDEGWATFDTPQFPVAAQGTKNFPLEAPSAKPSGMSSTMYDQLSSLHTMQWPDFQNSSAQSSLSVSDLWQQNFHAVQVAASSAGAQSWNAFDDPPVNDVKQVNEPHAESYLPLSTADQYLGPKFLEGSSKDGIQGAASYGGLPGPNGLSDVATGSSYAPSAHLPMMEETLPHPTDHRSTNPFDLPYDSGLEPDNMFMDTNSLHAALPNVHMPSTFIDGVGQSWFPQDPATAYLPAGSQGGLAYMAGQSPNSQLTNVPTQEPVASVGGNPFA